MFKACKSLMSVFNVEIRIRVLLDSSRCLYFNLEIRKHYMVKVILFVVGDTSIDPDRSRVSSVLATY